MHVRAVISCRAVAEVDPKTQKLVSKHRYGTPRAWSQAPFGTCRACARAQVFEGRSLGLDAQLWRLPAFAGLLRSRTPIVRLGHSLRCGINRLSSDPSATSCQPRPQTLPVVAFVRQASLSRLLAGQARSLRRGWTCGATLAPAAIVFEVVPTPASAEKHFFGVGGLSVTCESTRHLTKSASRWSGTLLRKVPSAVRLPAPRSARLEPPSSCPLVPRFPHHDSGSRESALP